MSVSEEDNLKIDILELCHKLPSTAELIKFIKEKEKKIPAVVNIFAIPPNLSKSDKEDLELLNLFISLLSSIEIYNKRPDSKWPDINESKEVVDYMKMKCKSFFDLITRRKIMVMILPESGHASDHFEDTSTIVDIHINILTKLFKSFQFPPGTIKQLDTILTSLVDQLNSHKLNWRETRQNSPFFSNTYYFEPEGASLRTFYLIIDNESWSTFIEKTSSKQEKFTMDYFDFLFTFNKTAMDKFRNFINETIDTITGDARKEIEDLLKPEYVNPTADVFVKEDK
jgi:hypothetical protein